MFETATITKNVEVSLEVDGVELAKMFWELGAKAQAKFFNELGSKVLLVDQLQAVTDSDDLSTSGRHAMGRIGEYS